MTLPSELFASLWQRLEAHASDIVSQPFVGRDAQEFAQIVRLSEDHSNADVPAEIGSYLAADPKGRVRTQIATRPAHSKPRDLGPVDK